MPGLFVVSYLSVRPCVFRLVLLVPQQKSHKSLWYCNIISPGNRTDTSHVVLVLTFGAQPPNPHMLIWLTNSAITIIQKFPVRLFRGTCNCALSVWCALARRILPCWASILDQILTCHRTLFHFAWFPLNGKERSQKISGHYGAFISTRNPRITRVRYILQPPTKQKFTKSHTL